MIRAIYFDLDNTLLPTSEHQQEALTHLYQELAGSLPTGVDLEQFAAAWVSAAYQRWDQLLQGAYMNYAHYLQVVLQSALETFQSSPRADLDLLAAAFAERMEQVSPDPAVLDILAQLSEQYVLGIVTNGPAGEHQLVRLERSGLAPYIGDRLFNAGDLGVRKPDPAIFHAALTPGLSPAEMLFVGDNLVTDVGGAQGAGWQAIWYNPTGRERPANAPLPSATVRDLADLLPWLAARR